MADRDPHSQRDQSGSELQIKAEMDRRLMRYFASKHGSEWKWCPVCRVWAVAHRHEGK